MTTKNTRHEFGNVDCLLCSCLAVEMKKKVTMVPHILKQLKSVSNAWLAEPNIWRVARLGEQIAH